MGNKVVAFIRSNEWFKSTMVEHGTHNGYVAVPSMNKYHGMSYLDINDIDVHGGIKFSEPAVKNLSEAKGKLIQGMSEKEIPYWIMLSLSPTTQK